MSELKEYWAFRFCLEAEDGSLVPRGQAEELLEVIVEWAEARDLQIGGGYREPLEKDGTAPLVGAEDFEDF